MEAKTRKQKLLKAEDSVKIESNPEPVRRSKRTAKGDSAPESETTVKRENKRKINLKVERVADSDKEKFDSEDGESDYNEDAVDDLPKNNRSVRSKEPVRRTKRGRKPKEDTTQAKKDDSTSLKMELRKVKEETLSVEDTDTESDETDMEEIEEKAKELSPLNRRGVPARIRKKNKLFYDDEQVPMSQKGAGDRKNRPVAGTSNTSASGVSSPGPSKKLKVEHPRSCKKMPTLKPMRVDDHSTTGGADSFDLDNTVPDKKIGQKIGPRLRNLLKLPQAHKWVCHEWFYSDLDRALFSGDNDFQLCLKETLPDLSCRRMSRIQWTIIRRMIGKPRRCSDAFFIEERRDLERRRNKLRVLQQRKHLDASSFKDLPTEIPLQLTIGSKVTARLRRPQDGLFTGTVDGFDTSNNTYRITFDRQGLGTHSIPDYEVLSNETPETLTLTNSGQIDKKSKGQGNISTGIGGSKDCASSDKDGAKNSSAAKNRTLNGYPVKLLELIVLVTKLLSEKKIKIKRLKDLNNMAERYNSYGGNLAEDFERKYASIMIKLEKLNRDLQNYLLQIRGLCIEVAPEPSFTTMLIPSHIRERCHSEALDIMEQYLGGHQTVINDGILELIKNLTALLIVMRTISGSDRNAFDLDLLQATTEQIKAKLSRDNKQLFEDRVEIHMHQIRAELAKNTPPLEF